MQKKGGNWSFDQLAPFIHSPKTFVPGTKMTFSGLSSASDEADVIAYLATLADTPVPLPK
jgi:cytochrome c